MNATSQKCFGLPPTEGSVLIGLKSASGSINRFVRGDSAGAVVAFQVSDGLVQALWSLLLRKSIAGFAEVASKRQLLVAFGTEVAVINSTNGALVSSFDTSLTQNIRFIQLESSNFNIHLATENTHVILSPDGKELGSWQTFDKIHSLALLNGVGQRSLTIVGLESRVIKILSNAHQIYEILETNGIPTILHTLEHLETPATALPNFLYGTDVGTFHCVSVTMDGGECISHNEVFAVNTLRHNKRKKNIRAGVSSITEFPILFDEDEKEQCCLAIGRTDGVFLLYTTKQQRPRILIEKKFNERVLKSVSWMESLNIRDQNSSAAKRLAPSILVSTFTGATYNVSLFPQSKDSEWNEEILSEALQRAKVGLKIANQELEKAANLHLLNKKPNFHLNEKPVSGKVTLLPNQNYESYTLSIEASEPIEMIALSSTDSVIYQLEIQGNADGIYQSKLEKADTLPATFICIRKIMQISFTLYPREGNSALISCAVFSDTSCLQTTHLLKPLCLHKRVISHLESENESLPNTLKFLTNATLATLNYWISLILPDTPEKLLQQETPITYVFESPKFSSKIKCILDKGILVVQTTTLTALDTLKTCLTRLATQYQIKIINQSLQLDLVQSLTLHLNSLLAIIDGILERDRNLSLIQGLKEVEGVVGDLREFLDQELMDIYVGGGTMNAGIGSDAKEAALWELAALYKSSYSLRGIEIGAERLAWFKDLVANGESSEGIRKLFFDQSF